MSCYYHHTLDVVCCLLEATSAVHPISQTKTALLDFYCSTAHKIFYNFHLYTITEDIQKRIQEITVNQSKVNISHLPLT